MLAIGHVIRQRRLLLGLTQEGLAGQLAVTGPAVSKWEKGLSYPDIELLPQIARTLQIDLNQLLAFKSDMTPAELRTFSAVLPTKSGYAAYELAKAKLKEFPNADQLRLMIAPVLQLQQPNMTAAQWATVAEFIENNYLHVMHGQAPNRAQQAAQMLFYFYLSEARYTDAEAQLATLSDAVVAYNAMRPDLYMRQHDVARTYAAGEVLLGQDVAGMTRVLAILIKNALNDGNLPYAQECVRVGRALTKMLQSSEAFQADSALLVAKATADREQVATVIDQLVAGFMTSTTPMLLAHIPKSAGIASVDKRQTIRQMLQAFVQDPELKFAWAHPKLRALLQEYEVANDD
ncbi:MAG: helix-turn-helix domain-containing protein [Lactobacillus sp.]|nr:helix-turn-helix domain-containing protein [Lactobacillus sp.]MCI2032303.1 helix-turn-helix domain-containing protein [Lactobacillus sp.]